MRHSLGIVVIAAVWGMQISLVAAQAREDLPPNPPGPNAVPTGTVEPNMPAPEPSPSTAAFGAGAPGNSDSNASPPSPIDSARTANNVLYAELLGNGGIYSINYERFFTDNIDARIGFDYISLSASSGSSSAHASILFVPVMVNYFGIGSANHKLELGLGPLLVVASASASGLGSAAHGSGLGIGGTATIGYRYVPHDGGFNFKVGFTPIFGAGGFLPLGGIGFGAVF